MHYRRYYSGSPGEAPESFEDTVDALEDSDLIPLGPNGLQLGRKRSPPCQMRLSRGEETLYRIDGALCRHLSEAHRLFGRGWAPYSWLGVMNRYFCRRLYLEVTSTEVDVLSEAFASETDLGSGATGPVRFQVCTPRRVVVTYENCPARTLVRVHWPMQSD